MKRTIENDPARSPAEFPAMAAQDRNSDQPDTLLPSSPRIHSRAHPTAEFMNDEVAEDSSSDDDEEVSWDDKSVSNDFDAMPGGDDENRTRRWIAFANTDPDLAAWASLLRSEKNAANLTIICHLDIPDPWTPLTSIWEALRHNTGLHKIYIDTESTTTGQILAETFPLGLLCDAIRDHSDLKKIFIVQSLIPLSADLNHELQTPCSPLKHLSLKMPQNQQALDQFTAALQKNTWLKSLRLTFDADSALDCSGLSEVLSRHTAMVTCQIRLPSSAPTCQTLIQGLSNCRLLRKLTLESVDDQHADAIADLIARSASLRKIYLNAADFSDDATRVLESALLQNFFVENFHVYPFDDFMGGDRASTRLHQTARFVTSRNKALAKLYDPVRAGHGISAGMELFGKPEFRNTTLPAEVGALIAKEIAMRLPPEQTLQILNAVSL